MITFLLVVLGICCFLCLYRVARGPTTADRAVATDILGILVVGFCAFFSLKTKQDWYMNIALIWTLLGFLGTITLAKYLEGKHFDE